MICQQITAFVSAKNLLTARERFCPVLATVAKLRDMSLQCYLLPTLENVKSLIAHGATEAAWNV
jgi:hypothetical protein